MITVTLAGKEFPLYFSTKTMIDMEKRIGAPISKISDWYGYDDTDAAEEVNTSEILIKTTGLLCDLINGGIYKHNCEIVLGLADGEKKPFVTEEAISGAISCADILGYQSKIFAAINEGMHYEKPEGMPESDPDLADVDSEKNLSAAV